MNQGHIMISGASGTLGQACCDKFLDKGFFVSALVRSKEDRSQLEKNFKRYSDRFRVFEESFESIIGLQTSVNSAEQENGPIGYFVHCAGAFQWKFLETTEAQDYELMMDSNLKSSWLVLRCLLPLMKSRRFGRIVFISSQKTLGAGEAGMGLYLAAKAGLNQLLMGGAEEARGTNVMINGLLPTIIDTPQNRKDMPEANFSEWIKPEEIAESILELFGPGLKRVQGALISLS
jgi:NAD(P)-dependent dehydrogenase (short-subunit alcohol dehydrogenase family)